MPEPLPDFSHNQAVYSVSEISQSIKRVLEDNFGVVKLRGEVSGWRGVHSSGHAYFTLKDDKAVINAVCWKGALAKLAHKPEEGLEVIATGRISAYNGKYQIVIDHIEPAGAGALMALLEKRRKMFEAEGLFRPERKKKLPFMPRVIGVITSPTGAVIRDILHRIEDRFSVHVLVWPVPVQGEGAAEKIAEAIAGFNSLNPQSPIPNPDLLIVARGGGSIEDLWAFNEEIVVRAVAASLIPLISAVGHETDTTLIDHVSDMRAPTPTAAAEIAVPVLAELRLGVQQLEVRLNSGWQQWQSNRSEQLRGLARGLPRPAQLLQTASQRFDDWAERLATSLPAMVARKSQQLAMVASGLRAQKLVSDIESWEYYLEEWQRRSFAAVTQYRERRAEKLAHLSSLLESVNYKRVLERGFTLVKDAHGKLVGSAKDARKKDALIVTFKDGEITVKP